MSYFLCLSSWTISNYHVIYFLFSSLWYSRQLDLKIFFFIFYKIWNWKTIPTLLNYIIFSSFIVKFSNYCINNMVGTYSIGNNHQPSFAGSNVITYRIVIGGKRSTTAEILSYLAHKELNYEPPSSSHLTLWSGVSAKI